MKSTIKMLKTYLDGSIRLMANVLLVLSILAITCHIVCQPIATETGPLAVNGEQGSFTFVSALIPSSRVPLSAAAGNGNEDTRDDSALSSLVHEREFVSPQVAVQIECQRDKTIMKLNFTQPFSGIIGSGKLDRTKCKLNGNGTKLYEIQVLHNSTQCDTHWDSVNSGILNTLYIRFHSSLETGSDIAKNVMCRLTVGDLVVGRRPIKQAAFNKLQASLRSTAADVSGTDRGGAESSNLHASNNR